MTFEEFIEKKLSQNNEITTDTASNFLQSGFQEYLNLLCSIFLADIIKSNNYPDGIVKRLKRSLTKPSLGGVLNNLLKWLAKQKREGLVKELSLYIRKKEKKNTSWLNKLVQYRNEWAHPKKRSPDEIISMVIHLLKNPPDLSEIGEIIVENLQVYWKFENEKVCLSPFVKYADKKFIVFREMSEENTLIYPQDNIDTKKEFADIWRTIRLGDNKLENPTQYDFVQKIKQVSKKYNVEVDEEYEKILANNFKGVILSNSIYKNILAGIQGEITNSFFLEFEVHAEVDLLKAFCRKVGIAKVSPKKFLEFNMNEKIFLIVHTDELNSEKFLHILYWMADLCEMEDSEKANIIIIRNENELIKDDEELWDKLPDNLDKFLLKHKNSSSFTLTDYLWQEKKGFFANKFSWFKK